MRVPLRSLTIMRPPWRLCWICIPSRLIVRFIVRSIVRSEGRLKVRTGLFDRAPADAPPVKDTGTGAGAVWLGPRRYSEMSPILSPTGSGARVTRALAERPAGVLALPLG